MVFRSSRRTSVAAAATVVALTVLALVPPAAAQRARPVQTFEVVAQEGLLPMTWEWAPAELTIRGRGKVTWRNPTPALHHVTFWDGPSAEDQHLEPGASATLTLRKPGVYEYWCDINGHADIVYVGYERLCIGMCGKITVE